MWALIPYGLFGPYPGEREGPVGIGAGGRAASWVPLHYTDHRAYPVDMCGFAFGAEVLWTKSEPVWGHRSNGGESQFIEEVLPATADFINPTKSRNRSRRGPFRIPRRWHCVPSDSCGAGYPLAVHNGWAHRVTGSAY
eukprot:gene14261-14155_t